MATISNTPRPGYIWDATDNVWYPIGVGAHQHTNAADTPAVMPYSTYAAAGKNKLINGDFAINQRGFTSTTTSAVYIFDRFATRATGGTSTFSAETFTTGTAPVSGYEFKNFLQIITTGQTTSDTRTAFTQNIESVRTLAGQTATVSFWARATSGTPSVACYASQYFGTGGSPSGPVDSAGQKLAITTSWARYSFTFNVPSISGKTIGTDNNDTLRFFLFTSGGSDWDLYTNSLGIQSTTIQFAGIQVEAGSTATAFQTATGNPISELAACQRYFYLLASGTGQLLANGIYTSATQFNALVQLPVTMRTTPTLSATTGTNYYSTYNGGSDLLNSLTIFSAGTTVSGLYNNSEAAGTQFRPAYAETNNAAAFVAFSAEL